VWCFAPRFFFGLGDPLFPFPPTNTPLRPTTAVIFFGENFCEKIFWWTNIFLGGGPPLPSPLQPRFAAFGRSRLHENCLGIFLGGEPLSRHWRPATTVSRKVLWKKNLGGNFFLGREISPTLQYPLTVCGCCDLFVAS